MVPEGSIAPQRPLPFLIYVLPLNNDKLPKTERNSQTYHKLWIIWPTETPREVFLRGSSSSLGADLIYYWDIEAYG